MAHKLKPDFVFRRNGRVHLNGRWASVQLTTGSQGVRNSGSNAGYTMFRGSVKSTGYPLHSPVSPSVPLPCVTVCHHISTRLYDALYWPIHKDSPLSEHKALSSEPTITIVWGFQFAAEVQILLRRDKAHSLTLEWKGYVFKHNYIN